MNLFQNDFAHFQTEQMLVISRQSDYQAEGCIVVNSLEAALKVAQENGDDEPFIIGGGQIYKLALSRI